MQTSAGPECNTYLVAPPLRPSCARLYFEPVEVVMSTLCTLSRTLGPPGLESWAHTKASHYRTSRTIAGGSLRFSGPYCFTVVDRRFFLLATARPVPKRRRVGCSHWVMASMDTAAPFCYRMVSTASTSFNYNARSIEALWPSRV